MIEQTKHQFPLYQPTTPVQAARITGFRGAAITDFDNLVLDFAEIGLMATVPLDWLLSHLVNPDPDRMMEQVKQQIVGRYLVVAGDNKTCTLYPAEIFEASHTLINPVSLVPPPKPQEPDFPMHRVDSSAVEEIGYHAPSKVMAVKWKGSGKHTKYGGVPKEVFTDALEAKSIGKFLNASVANKFVVLDT
jgi:hypothetical protein